MMMMSEEWESETRAGERAEKGYELMMKPKARSTTAGKVEG